MSNEPYNWNSESRPPEHIYNAQAGEAEFSTNGVRLSYLSQTFTEECGGVRVLQNQTTAYVCETFIKPRTFGTKLSLCDLIKSQNEEHLFGDAKWFISHAWLVINIFNLLDSSSYHLGNPTF